MNVRRKREEKRLLPDCPGTKKKRDTFFISYLAYKEKNIKKEAKIAEEGDGGKLLGTVQRSEFV